MRRFRWKPRAWCRVSSYRRRAGWCSRRSAKAATDTRVNGARMFEKGLTLDRYFETRAGVIWISASVPFVGPRLLLTDLLVYPTTGSKLEVGLSDMLEIFTIL